jgi:hypothetical protein
MMWLLVLVVAALVVVILSSQDYNVLEWIIFGVFLLAVLVFGLFIVVKVDALEWLREAAGGTDLVQPDPEVYFVPGDFTYSKAQSLCRAYGGKLATYDQVTKAQADGAEWCYFGWSDDQMVLHPTQTRTWERFKKYCGRPGVNGGFSSNPGQKLGANCYGNLPASKA